MIEMPTTASDVRALSESAAILCIARVGLAAEDAVYASIASGADPQSTEHKALVARERKLRHAVIRSRELCAELETIVHDALRLGSGGDGE